MLKKLVACSDRTGFRVNATGAPFAAKDTLKARGYRWDTTKSCWWTEIAEDAVDVERVWLGTSVSAGSKAVPSAEAAEALSRGARQRLLQEAQQISPRKQHSTR